MDIKRIILIALLSFIAGCYETEVPLLDKGEKVALAGTFQCKSLLNGKIQKLTLSEQKSGVWPFASYAYVDEGGSPLLFKKLSDNRYILQAKVEGGRFGYFFVEVGSNGIIISMPNTMTKINIINELGLKHKINFQPSKSGKLIIVNTPNSSILQFFASHEASALINATACMRT